MAYSNKTLARITGVEPQDNETQPADKDQDFALTPSEAPLRITRSLSNEAPHINDIIAKFAPGAQAKKSGVKGIERIKHVHDRDQ
ncbi:hypothetical protein [Bifidobacterium margollesii]|uniref:hypothetical protein n=1 Tax=Bifidobacterium margollesii TaxID=2020964 RepID=UPI001A9C6811|nr:hypothetical protein [Bifidobacterium margollesii]